MRVALPFKSRNDIEMIKRSNAENATWIRRIGSFTMALLVIAMVLSFVACASPKIAIDAENVAPLWDKVLERHDHYVIADTSLTEDERTSYLVSTELIREVIATALAKRDADRKQKLENESSKEPKAIPDPVGS